MIMVDWMPLISSQSDYLTETTFCTEIEKIDLPTDLATIIVLAIALLKLKH